MKAHYITRTLHFTDKSADAFHFEMFHGRALRVGSNVPLRSYRFGEDLELPLVVRKNVHNLSHIFQPNASLIVSDVAATKLKSSADISLLEVKFGTLFYYPSLEWDFSHYSKLGDYDAYIKFIENASHNSELARYMPAYFEVVTRRAMDCLKDGKQIVARIESEKIGGGEKEIAFSGYALERYGLLWDCGHIFSERAFNSVGDLFDRRYFFHKVLEA